MKRIFAITLIVCIVLSMAACGGKNKSKPGGGIKGKADTVQSYII